MERAKQLWDDSSYQSSKPQEPWSAIISVYGPMRIKPSAGRVLGDHYETGEKRLQQCVPVTKLGVCRALNQNRMLKEASLNQTVI